MGRLSLAARYYGRVLRLPPYVASFYIRARRLASRTGDDFTIGSALPPQSIRPLMRAAGYSNHVVEIGTGTAWSTIVLALVQPQRLIISYDPIPRPERERYLALAGPEVRERIEFRAEPGEAGPHPGDSPADFVFVDGSHETERTVTTFEVWRTALAPGGAIAFHDYGNAAYPGVTEAIERMGLEGEVVEDVFVWRAPQSGRR